MTGRIGMALRGPSGMDQDLGAFLAMMLPALAANWQLLAHNLVGWTNLPKLGGFCSRCPVKPTPRKGTLKKNTEDKWTNILNQFVGG